MSRDLMNNSKTALLRRHKQQLHTKYTTVPCLRWYVWRMHIHATVCGLVYDAVLA